MSYAKNIELTRVQLHRSISRDHARYGVIHRPSKEAMAIKLIRYCTRVNGNLIFAGLRDFNETDLNIGWAGKKRKQQMRERQSVFLGRKHPKVSRVGYSRDNQLLTLKKKMIMLKAMPVEPVSGLSVPSFQEAILIRNHNRGELHILDFERTVKVIPWVSDENATEEAFFEAWGTIEYEPIPFVGSGVRPLKPLFRTPRWRMAT